MEKAESDCSYELKASVPTGLEVGASEECQEVVGRLTHASRGRITFTILNLEDLIKVEVIANWPYGPSLINFIV